MHELVYAATTAFSVSLSVALSHDIFGPPSGIAVGFGILAVLIIVGFGHD